MLQVQLSRKVHFSAAHKYANPSWNDEKNKEVFGACFSKHGHGHNFVLEVHIQGPIDSETGMIINLTDLDAILKEVSGELDHRHLNFDIEAFKNKIPTTENIALYCFEEVRRRLSDFPRLKLTRLKLNEGEDLWSEVLND